MRDTKNGTKKGRKKSGLSKEQESLKKVLTAYTLSDLPTVQVSYQPPRGKVYVDCDATAETIFRTVIGSDAFVSQQIYVLFVDVNDELLSWRCISMGDVDHVTVNTKLILTIACALNAKSIFIGHTLPNWHQPYDNDKISVFLKMLNPFMALAGIRIGGYLLLGVENVADMMEAVGFVPENRPDITGERILM